MGFVKTIDQPTTFHWPPTNQPTNDLPPTIGHPTTNHMYRTLTNRPPISKKFKDQEKTEFMFDITYMTLNTEFLKSCSASCTHINCYAYVCFLANSFLFSFFVSRKASIKRLLSKSNTEGLLLLCLKEDVRDLKLKTMYTCRDIGKQSPRGALLKRCSKKFCKDSQENTSIKFSF